MENSEHFDLDNNGFNLIDFASENDNLFFLVSPISHQPNSQECQGDSARFETIGDTDCGNVSQSNDQLETVPELAQSGEPQRTRSGKCNLRKSLAWDNAFFTDAGVLDHEELTSMMDGREAVHKQFLPGIQEDLQRSTDSISTLESDNFTLECLEAELFEDIRASIQKSSKSAKAPNADFVSQKRLNSMPLKNEAIGMHNTGVPKCQPKADTGIQGSTKAVKRESGRPVVPKSAVKTGDLASSISKPPKGTSKSSSATPAGTKVTSVASGRLRAENANAKTVSVKGSHASKTTSSSGPGRVLSKPASTLQSSSQESSLSKSQPKRFSNGPSCESTEERIKPPSATMTRKTPPKIVNSPSSRATPRPSSINALKNKAKSENSAVAAYLLSTKGTESISPTSSVSEWSSASSSSSAVNQRSNKSRSSFGSSSCRSLDGDAPPLNLKAHAGQIPRRQEIKRSGESIRKPSSQTGVVSGSTSMKPTGLRMPSPKIGFFDGVKSVRSSSGAMQSPAGLPVASTKVGSGVSPTGISNIKQKVSKLSSGRVPAARKHETKNPDAPLTSQGTSQVTPPIGDHQKMVESNETIQENGREEHDEVSPKENVHVIKNEKVLGDNQDFCSGVVELVDPEHDNSKTEMAPLPSQGNSHVAPCIGEHDKTVESNENMQANGSEQHSEGGPKESAMVLGDNQIFCSVDANFVDSEQTDSKTESCGSINTPKRLDAPKLDGHDNLGSSFNSNYKIDEKENVPYEGQMDQSSKDEGRLKSDTVGMQNVEPLPPATSS